MKQFPNRVNFTYTKNISQNDVLRFVQISKQVYEDEPINDVSVVEWKHFSNPIGTSGAVEAVLHDEDVGRIWLQRHSWSYFGARVTMMFPQDLAVVGHARRAGLVLGLLKRSFEYANSEAHFVYHSSNNDSEPIYERLFKFKRVTELEMFGMLLRPFSILESRQSFPKGFKFMGALVDNAWDTLLRLALTFGQRRITLTAQPPNRDLQEGIVDKFLARQHLANSRSHNWRMWRFSGAGLVRYETLWIYENETLLGYVVTSRRKRMGIDAVFVVDLVWAQSPSKRQVKSLWRELILNVPRRTCDLILAFGNINNPDIKKSLVFPLVRIPDAVRPQRFPIYVRAGDAVTATGPFVESEVRNAASQGFFMLADLDVI
jgi:hypothetical protein